jgi:hypothetical protein
MAWAWYCKALFEIHSLAAATIRHPSATIELFLKSGLSQATCIDQFFIHINGNNRIAVVRQTAAKSPLPHRLQESVGILAVGIV